MEAASWVVQQPMPPLMPLRRMACLIMHETEACSLSRLVPVYTSL